MLRDFVLVKSIQDQSGGDAELTAVIKRELMRQLRDTLKLGGWEFILEDEKESDEHGPHYLLHFADPNLKDGDSCAQGKIETLRRLPRIGNTGELKKSPRDMHFPEMVTWYGGINLHYIGDEDGEKVKGVVRMAFSGANEAVDLMIVIKILQAYLSACDKLYPTAAYEYNFEPLMNDQLFKALINFEK